MTSSQQFHSPPPRFLNWRLGTQITEIVSYPGCLPLHGHFPQRRQQQEWSFQTQRSVSCAVCEPPAAPPPVRVETNAVEDWQGLRPLARHPPFFQLCLSLNLNLPTLLCKLWYWYFEPGISFSLYWELVNFFHKII